MYMGIKIIAILIVIIRNAVEGSIEWMLNQEYDEDTQKLVNEMGITEIGLKVPQKFKTNVIEGDESIPIASEYKITNGEMSGGVLEIVGAFHNGNEIKEGDYNITYYIRSTDGYYSDNIFDINKNGRNSENNVFINNEFDCGYSVRGFEYDYKTINISYNNDNDIRKIVFYYKANIALYQDNLIYLIKDYEKFNKENNLLLLNYTEKINDIQIIKDRTNGNGFLILKSNSYYKIYSIIYNQLETQYYTYSIQLNEIHSFNIENDEIITDLKVNANELLIYYNVNNSISIYDINNFSKNPTNIRISTTHTLISFEILNAFIYALYENEGIIIYERNEQNIITEVNKIIHKNILSIDLFQNPFTGYYFLGCLLNTNNLDVSNKQIPFFIEFYINNTNFNILHINKIFTHLYPFTITSFISFDSFQSYFLNTQSKQLIIIRRAMLNTIPFFTYIKTLYFRNSRTPEIFFVNQYAENSNFHLGFLAGNQIRFIRVRRFPYHQISCTFNGHGKYHLFLAQSTDACESNLNYQGKDAICYKMFEYSFDIKQSKTGKIVQIVIGIVSGIVLAVFIGMIVWVFVYHKGENLNKLKLIKIDKNDKMKLYQVNEKDEIKRNLQKDGIKMIQNDESLTDRSNKEIKGRRNKGILFKKSGNVFEIEKGFENSSNTKDISYKEGELLTININDNKGQS